MNFSILKYAVVLLLAGTAAGSPLAAAPAGTAAGVTAEPTAPSGTRPGVAAAMTTFYYDDMRKAAAWYENTLGLKKFVDKGWIVIFEVTPTMHLGVVTASDGSLRPTTDKGTMISIETNDLDAWYARLKDRPGINLIHGIEPGAKGMIREFRMFDPGGYQIEFFSWNAAADPRNAKTLH